MPPPRESGTPFDLPPPEPEALAHGERVKAHIDDAIAAAGGRIDFAHFMQLALYAPGLGYYSAGAHKLGAAGDFITAPEASPLFGRCLARQCAQVLVQTGGSLLEFGAGSGVLAVELLAELERLDALPEAYLILEVSADLRERQLAALHTLSPALAGRVRWLDAPPDHFHGVVIANELLDAIPVHRFRITDADPCELFVVRRDDGYDWEPGQPADDRVRTAIGELQQRYHLPPGYESELNLDAAEWVRDLGRFLDNGVAFLIDYGYPGSAFYHPARTGGTLMCHYRHRAHPNPFHLPGLEDITAHVDFTAAAEAALEGGLSVLGFTNQANFLLANGLAELAVSPSGDVEEQFRLAAQVKRLTMPGEMGERFRVLALGRGLGEPLRGFALRDERGRL